MFTYMYIYRAIREASRQRFKQVENLSGIIKVSFVMHSLYACNVNVILCMHIHVYIHIYIYKWNNQGELCYALAIRLHAYTCNMHEVL